MKDGKPDYNKVLAITKKVLEENYVLTPPIDIVEIASNYGLTVHESSFDEVNNVAGFIDPETRKIVVNESDSPNRKSFTIAHELGHWLMHQSLLESDPDTYAILYRIPLGGASEDYIEREANFFAANLLVPSEMLHDFYHKRGYDMATIAEIFRVSQEVIGYRIKNEYGRSLV